MAFNLWDKEQVHLWHAVERRYSKFMSRNIAYSPEVDVWFKLKDIYEWII